MQGKRLTEFDLLVEYFAAKNEKAEENILLMESFFDVWCINNLKEQPSSFITRFISTRHEPDKSLKLLFLSVLRMEDIRISMTFMYYQQIMIWMVMN